MDRCTDCGVEFKEGDTVLMTVVLKVKDGKLVPIESIGKFHMDCINLES